MRAQPERNRNAQPVLRSGSVPVKFPAMLTVNRDALRERRLHAGLSVRELAAAARVSVQTVVDLEHRPRLRGSRPSTVRRLAEALGCEVADLVELDRKGAA